MDYRCTMASSAIEMKLMSTLEVKHQWTIGVTEKNLSYKGKENE